MDAVTDVSRETSSASFSDRPLHPVEARTTRKGEATRRALIEALVGLIEAGILRPTAARVAKRAGRVSSSVTAFFSGLEMLCRAAVRDPASRRRIELALKLPETLSDAERERLVWLIVAGVEKPR